MYVSKKFTHLLASIIVSVVFAVNSNEVFQQSPPNVNPAHPIELPWRKWGGKRIMMVSAHPDDIEACAGGTVKLMTQVGINVSYVIFTNGDKGCQNSVCQNISNTDLAVMREKEAYNAAGILGVPTSQVRMLGYEDGLLASYSFLDTRQTLIAEIRRFQPHIVMSWFQYPNMLMLPALGWDDLGYHTDHQESARLVMYSMMPAGNPRMFRDLGKPWTVEQHYIWTFLKPTYYTDISSVIGFKESAYAAHTSQAPNASFAKTSMQQLAVKVAQDTVGFTGQYAEGFTAFF